MIHESFQRFPGVEQSHAAVVNHVSVLIARILIVSGLKCEWRVNEIEIEIVEPESRQTRFEGRFHALGPVIGVPQLCGDENVFARDISGGSSRLQRLAYFALVPVSFRAIEVSKSGFQRVFSRSYREGCVGNQGAEAERGNLADSVVE